MQRNRPRLLFLGEQVELYALLSDLIDHIEYRAVLLINH
jgi:hypothetical protein